MFVFVTEQLGLAKQWLTVVLLLAATMSVVVIVDMMVAKQLEDFAIRLSRRPVKELLVQEHSLLETLSC